VQVDKDTKIIGVLARASRTPPDNLNAWRAVPMMASHVALNTTQRYVEAHAEAQQHVIDLVDR
jgi:hypothetical protein